MDETKTIPSLADSGQTRFQTAEELVAYRERVWALFTYTFGPWRFRWPTCEVFVGDVVVRLSETEADVLKVLIDAWPMPLLPGEILARMSVETSASADELKAYVRRVRLRLGMPAIIVHSGRGVGYRFNPEAVM